MNHTYIIGEIGQNHNGSVDLAKLIVDLVSRPVHEDAFNLDLRPMDAVKMTKRDLNEELTDSQMNRPYDSPNSFGRTYGEHRAKLELTDEEHFEVYRHAKSLGLDFVETLCSPGCLSLLKLFTPDRLKVASRDLTNLPLLEAMAETRIPIILSALRVAIPHGAGQPESAYHHLPETALRAIHHRFFGPYHWHSRAGSRRSVRRRNSREAYYYRPSHEGYRPTRLVRSRRSESHDTRHPLDRTLDGT